MTSEAGGIACTSDAFGVYADSIVKADGDRVKNRITLNEILFFTCLGYGNGQKAPGFKLPEQVVNQTYQRRPRSSHFLAVRNPPLLRWVFFP
jgi:beta-glucosidase/6-phospho-beta-glucosidase/beta-galactosidase